MNTFYDTGCSHAVFKSGVPGTELKGQLVAKGPFRIGGVGGLTLGRVVAAGAERVLLRGGAGAADMGRKEEGEEEG